MVKYSQNDEQKYILEHFKHVNNGRFLNIGAFDAFALSNTRCLYEKGFKGVLVEPSPPRLKIITEQYKDDPDVLICDKAISSKSGVVDFYITEDALSSIEETHTKKWFNKKFEKSTVEVITPTQLFDKYGYDFNFISLDVESNNLDVVRHIPFDKLTELSLFIVEYDNYADEMNDIIKKYEFIEIHRNGENLIFKRANEG